jgi:hypothetical protein
MQNRGVEIASGSLVMVPRGHVYYLCQVQGLPIGALSDLFAATEAVCDDQTIGRRFPNRGQEFEFANGE